MTDEARRERFAATLEAAGLEVDAAIGNADARLRVRRARPHVALVEVGEGASEGALRALAGEDPTLPLVAAGPANVESILGALREGARDYLPVETERAEEWSERMRRAGVVSLFEDRLGASGDAVIAAIREAEASRETAEEVRVALADRTAAFRELEEVYRNDLERMLVLFESVSEGLLFADRRGAVVLMNAAAGALLECSPLEAVGKRIDALQGEPGVRAALAEECEEAFSSGTRERIVHDGSRRRILVRTIPTPPSSPAPKGTLILLRDVTAEVRARRERSIALRLAARRLRALAFRLAGEAGKRSAAAAEALEEEALRLESAARGALDVAARGGRSRPSDRDADLVTSLP